MNGSTEPTKKDAFKYWASKIEEYRDCGELNTTMMGEDAACYFGMCSENGDTEIEKDLFDWAVDFETQWTKFLTINN